MIGRGGNLCCSGLWLWLWMG